MKEKFVTKERLDRINLHERIYKRYKISPAILQEILIGLEIDSFLGKNRFSNMSNKITRLWGIYISARSLRYIYRCYQNYNEVYLKVKKGGKLKGLFKEHLYKRT